ncbi:MAG: histidine phosphatase family protein, partial [Planctomycetes bacterium]|nr:histidine phosphatase family protein [Planctomycetota bacterium]
MVRTVYLVRHLPPPAGNEGRYWGRLDPGCDTGEADRLVALCRDLNPAPTRLLTSPRQRAMTTALTLAGPLGVEPETDPDLAEVDFGDFDGRTLR